MTSFKLAHLLLICAFSLMVSCSDSGGADKANAFVERSMAYEEQGQYRAALIEMRNAMQAAPDNIDFKVHYAELLNDIGSPNEAEELLKTQKNNLDAVRLPLAEALLLQGKYISAQEVLKDWKSNPAEQDLYNRLMALQTYLAGNTNQALATYRTLAGKASTPIETKHEFISLLVESNLSQEAEKWTNQLLADNPKDPVLLYYKAKIAYNQNQLVVAETQLTEALFHLPETDILLNDRLQVLELLSNVLTELGRPTEALIYSRLIREANPDAFLARQQYTDALNAISAGDLTSAKAAFEDILNQFPNNQQAALLLGLVNIQEGDITTGEALLSENVDTETNPVSIIQATALAQAEQGKPDEALAVLERAILARPDDTTLLSLYGIISLNNNQAQQGIQSISKALQLEPERTRLRLLLAQYYVEQQQPDLALGHLRTAYEQNMQDWPTTGYYLRTLIAQNEFNEAEAVNKRLSTEAADDPSALWLVSMTNYLMGNTESAVTEMAKLHESVPDNINIISALASLYEQTNQPDRAAESWIKALEINPGSTQFLQSTVRNKSATLNAADLTQWLLTQANSRPEIALPLHSTAAELLIRQQKLAQAQTLAKQYANNDQPMARALKATVLRGEAYPLLEAENWQAGLDKVNDAIRLVPDNAGLAIMASQIHMRMNDYQDALAVLNAYLNEQTQDYRVILEKTRLVDSNESSEAALAYLKPIWKAQPNRFLAQTYFGLVNRLEPQSFEAAINELLSAEPNNTGAYIALAEVQRKKDQVSRAVASYKKALAINPNLVVAYNNLSWLIKDDQPAEALTYAQKAAELAPNSASVLDTYGWILHLNGLRSDAIKTLESALELAPDNEEIKAHLATVSK